MTLLTFGGMRLTGKLGFRLLGGWSPVFLRGCMYEEIGGEKVEYFRQVWYYIGRIFGVQ